MGNQPSDLALSPSDAKSLESETDYNREEIKGMYDQFHKKYSTGFMTKDEFLNEAREKHRGGSDEFWEELFDAFNHDGDSKIDFRGKGIHPKCVVDMVFGTEFLFGMSMLTHGDVSDKLAWAFKMFDEDGNGVLDEAEVTAMLKTLFKANSTLQGEGATGVEGGEGPAHSSSSASDAGDEAQNIFKEMDANGDGEISLDEFIAACKTNEDIQKTLEQRLHAAMEVDTEVELDVFGNQVAGHKGDDAMLKEDNFILKPLHPVEFDFYSTAVKALPEDVQGFFPSCAGRKTMEDADGVVKHYVKMEDLTYGLEGASICDLKIGYRGHDDLAGGKKVLEQKTICAVTTSRTLGFRMCGMRIWKRGGSYRVCPKPFGAKLNKNTMKGALGDFFDNGDGLHYEVIPHLLPKLRVIREWFASQDKYVFYSSSVLLVYDGANPTDGSKTDVRIVDFAHTFPQKEGAGIDTNYLGGLDSVIALLAELVDDNNAGEIWENEYRRNIISKYQPCAGKLGGRTHYSDAKGRPMGAPNPSRFVLNTDSEGTDANGWQYAHVWVQKKWGARSRKTALVRRRRYVAVPGRSAWSSASAGPHKGKEKALSIGSRGS